MLCDNCKNREANVKYTKVINGIKKEMNLCEECSQKLGITNNWSMPIDFSSFLGILQLLEYAYRFFKFFRGFYGRLYSGVFAINSRYKSYKM